ncbi:cell adhesion molecule 2-like [Anneissia japonica]|uniref:cell adhesion molecule 2-like n=1 Tax=Anneissia japonica TaxID=1529436 RepID=UPI001425BB70|nr:cell adhesion molecule 2-like [Anneissia japonica]
MYENMCTTVLLVLASVFQLSIGIDFLVKPDENVRVLVGSTVTLRCSFSNKGNFDIYWFKADTMTYISFERSFYMSMPRYRVIGNVGEYNLQITNIQVSDEGEYRCGYFPANSQFRFARAIIVVLVKPSIGSPMCSTRTSAPMLRPGDLVSLVCKSSGGRPPASLRWFRGEQAIGVSRITTNEVSPVLQPEDNGRQFVCKLSHETLNKPRTCSIVPLKILPVVMVQPDALTVDVGQDASFRCNANGIPRIKKITWLINNTMVNNGMDGRIFLQDNSFVLVIKNVTLRDDNTLVTCKATTPTGLANMDSGILFVIKDYKPSTTLLTTQLQTTEQFTTGYQENEFINAKENNKKQIFGAIFGSVLAFLFVATILFITVRLCVRRRKRRPVSEMNMSQLRGNGSVYSMTNDYGPAPTVTDPVPNQYKTLGTDGKLPSVYQNLIGNSVQSASVSQVVGYTSEIPNVDNEGSGEYYEVVAKNDDNDNDINDYETLGRDSNGIIGRTPPERRYDTPCSMLFSVNNQNTDRIVSEAYDGTYEIPTALKSQDLRQSDTLDSKGYVCPKQLYISTDPMARSNEHLLGNSCDGGKEPLEDYVDMDKSNRTTIIYQQSINSGE